MGLVGSLTVITKPRSARAGASSLAALLALLACHGDLLILLQLVELRYDPLMSGDVLEALGLGAGNPGFRSPRMVDADPAYSHVHTEPMTLYVTTPYVQHVVIHHESASYWACAIELRLDQGDDVDLPANWTRVWPHAVVRFFSHPPI